MDTIALVVYTITALSVAILTGVLITVFNPKAMLFFIALFP